MVVARAVAEVRGEVIRYERVGSIRDFRKQSSAEELGVVDSQGNLTPVDDAREAEECHAS